MNVIPCHYFNSLREIVCATKGLIEWKFFCIFFVICDYCGQ